MLKLVAFDARLGTREGDDGRKLLASYPADTPESTRAIVGLAGGLVAYGSAWEGATNDVDDESDDETDDDEGDVAPSAVPPLERGFAVHFERSRWVMHRDVSSRGVWWLLIADASWIGPCSPTDASLQQAAATAASVCSLLAGPVEKLLKTKESLSGAEGGEGTEEEEPLEARRALAGPVAALGAALESGGCGVGGGGASGRREAGAPSSSSPSRFLATAALEGAFRPPPATCARAAAATGPRLAAAAASAGASLLDDFEGRSAGGGQVDSGNETRGLVGVWIARCSRGGDGDAGLLWTNVSPRDAAGVAALAALAPLCRGGAGGSFPSPSTPATSAEAPSSSGLVSSAADAAAKAASDVAARFSGMFVSSSSSSSKKKQEREERGDGGRGGGETAAATAAEAMTATTAAAPLPPSPSCPALDPSRWRPLDPSDPHSLLGVVAEGEAAARPLPLWLEDGRRARLVATPALVPAASVPSSSTGKRLARAPFRALLFLEGHEDDSDVGDGFLSSLARGAFGALAPLSAAAAADGATRGDGGDGASSSAALGPGGHVPGARYSLRDLSGGLSWSTPSAKADTAVARGASGGGWGSAIGDAAALLLSAASGKGGRTLTQTEAALGAAASEALGWEGECGDAEALVRPATASGGGLGAGGGPSATGRAGALFAGMTTASTAAATSASAGATPAENPASPSSGTWACASRCGSRSLNLLLRPGGVRGGDDAAAASAALAAFAERSCGGGLE